MKKEKVEFNWDADQEEETKGVSDFLKKIMATALSSPFLSEEQLKSCLSSLNLSTDRMVQIISGAKKSKEEILQRIGGEFSKLVQKIDLVKEFKDMLHNHRISIRADIEFIPKKEDKKETKSNQKRTISIREVAKKKIKKR